MLIKESALRRIIREEARRVLREDAGSSTGGGGSGPMTQQEFNDVGARLGVPAGSTVSIDVLRSYLNGSNAQLEAFWKADDALNSALVSLLSSVPQSQAAAQSSKDILRTQGSDGPLGRGIAAYLANLNATTLGLVGCLVAGAANANGPVYQGKSGNLDAINIIKSIDPGKLTDGGNALRIALQGDRSIMTSLRTITSTSVRAMMNSLDAENAAKLKAGSSQTYTVKSGDSISKIAQARYGIAPSRANMQLYTQLAATIKNRPGATADKIEPGDIINLPPTLGGKNLK